jgi:Leucine-rich repeat (LRR) protein
VYVFSYKLLRTLDLSHNRLRTYQAGRLPASLETLDASHNKLTDITGLGELTKLRQGTMRWLT